MSTNQKKTPKDKFWVRLVCIILAAVMVIGVATTAIFLIVDAIGAALAPKEETKKSASAATAEYIAAPVSEENDIWTVNV